MRRLLLLSLILSSGMFAQNRYLASADEASWNNSITNSSVDASGNPNFLGTAANTVLPINGGTTSLVMYIGGQLQVLNTNVTLTLPVTASVQQWILAKVDTTNANMVAADFLGMNTVPQYAYTAPTCPSPSPALSATNPAFWFDLSTNLSKLCTSNAGSYSGSDAIVIGVVNISVTPAITFSLTEPFRLNPYRRYELFGTGADGSLTVTSGTTTIDVPKQYTSVVITGGTLTQTGTGTSSFSTGVYIHSQNPILIVGGTVSTKGLGRITVNGGTGAGTAGTQGAFGGCGGGGGGSGTTSAAGAIGGNCGLFLILGSTTGGGTAGAATPTGGGTGHSSTGFPTMASPVFGGIGASGASGAGDATNAGGSGGASGGAIAIWAPSILVASGISVISDGNNGGNGAAGKAGGGGGGGGGFVVLTTYAGGAVASVTAAVSLSANDSPVVHSGTAQSGGSSTITLAAGASATDDLYNGQTIKTTGGAGPSQVRTIIGYVGSTKVATVDHAWATNPDVTTIYAVLATDNPKLDSSLRTTDVNSANLDAAVSSRSTYSGGAVASVTAAVTVGTNNDKTGYELSAAGVDDIWDEATSGHTSAGTTGKALIDAGASGADPWDTLLPGSYAPGSAGDIVGNNLDAAVSSRSVYAGTDTSGTTTLLGRLTSGRAGNLDNLDAAVSTRSSHSAADVWAVGTRTLTAFTIAVDITSAAVSSIWDKLLTGITTASTIGKLIKDNLDAAISSRLATSGYTAPDNSDITAIKAKTDNLPASPAAVSDIPTAAANASATWDAVRASHTTSGTFGQGVSSVQGNVTGSAASVTADVGITQGAADKAWSTATRALTDKAGFALTSAYDPAKTAAQAGDAMALTSGERDSVAEAALKLDWTTVTGAASRSTMNALRFLRNKWSFAGTTLTVTEEDDTTSAWTGDVTTSSSAQPITSVDPT